MDLRKNKVEIKYKIPITRDSLLDFPFPHKLWIIVNVDHCKFLRWSEYGASILINVPDLQQYLNSIQSIFKIKSICKFINQLEQYQFQRIEASRYHNINIVEFYHENFQGQRFDLLNRVRRSPHLLNLDLNRKAKARSQENESNFVGCKVLQSNSDLCYTKIGSVSNLQLKQFSIRAESEYQNLTRTLQNKLLKADEIAKRKHAESNRNSGMVILDPVIEISAENYENPQDSILPLDHSKSEYAGYYGDVDAEDIKRFCGEYLPKYQSEDRMGPNGVNIRKYTVTSKFAAEQAKRHCTRPIIVEAPKSSSLDAKRFKSEQAELKRSLMKQINGNADKRKMASANAFLQSRSIPKTDQNLNTENYFMLPQDLTNVYGDAKENNPYEPQIWPKDGIIQGNPFMEPMPPMMAALSSSTPNSKGSKKMRLPKKHPYSDIQITPEEHKAIKQLERKVILRQNNPQANVQITQDEINALQKLRDQLSKQSPDKQFELELTSQELEALRQLELMVVQKGINEKSQRQKRKQGQQQQIFIQGQHHQLQQQVMLQQDQMQQQQQIFEQQYLQQQTLQINQIQQQQQQTQDSLQQQQIFEQQYLQQQTLQINQIQQQQQTQDSLQQQQTFEQQYLQQQTLQIDQVQQQQQTEELLPPQQTLEQQYLEQQQILQQQPIHIQALNEEQQHYIQITDDGTIITDPELELEALHRLEFQVALARTNEYHLQQQQQQQQEQEQQQQQPEEEKMELTNEQLEEILKVDSYNQQPEQQQQQEEQNLIEMDNQYEIIQNNSATTETVNTAIHDCFKEKNLGICYVEDIDMIGAEETVTTEPQSINTAHRAASESTVLFEPFSIDSIDCADLSFLDEIGNDRPVRTESYSLEEYLQSL